MLEKITEILHEMFNLEDVTITPDTELVTELALTSFQLMGLITRIEDEFDIEIDDSQIRGIRTVGEMVEYVRKMRE